MGQVFVAGARQANGVLSLCFSQSTTVGSAYETNTVQELPLVEIQTLRKL
jgi:hypothetical protein